MLTLSACSHELIFHPMMFHLRRAVGFKHGEMSLSKFAGNLSGKGDAAANDDNVKVHGGASEEDVTDASTHEVTFKSESVRHGGDHG